MIEKRKNHEKEKFLGWRVVLGCFCLLFFTTSIISNTSALLMVPICGEFGFKTAEYSVMNLIGAIMGAISAVVLAPQLKKGNVKKVLVGCGIVSGIFYMMMGLCTELWQFFLVSSVANFALGGVSQLPVSYLITRWFDDKRSIAMSISFSGGALGGTIWSVIFGNLIESGNWQYCYYIGGILVIIFATLISLILIKKDPESCNQKPYKQENKSNDKNVIKDDWIGIDKKIATKTKPYYILVGVMFLLGTLVAGVSTHSINYLVGIGWDVSEASKVLSLFSFVGIFGLFLGGVLYDKMGVVKATFVASVAAVLGLICLMIAKNPIFGYLYAVCFCIGTIPTRLLPALVVSVVFGTKDYASIYSYLNIFFLVGCSIGSIITGVINDFAGYQIAWIFYMVVALLLFVSTFMAIKSSKYLREQYPNEA